MLNVKALKIAHYRFTDKKGKEVDTSKLVLSLADFGTYTLCTPLVNDYPLLSTVDVVISVEDNKIIVKSIADKKA